MSVFASALLHRLGEELPPKVFDDPVDVLVTTPVDAFFSREKEKWKSCLEQDTTLAPFRFLPDPLLTFLCADKARGCFLSDKRVVRDEAGEEISGYESHIACGAEDAYHPKQFRSFDVQGFWMPVLEGRVFSILKPEEPCPFIRLGPSGQEFLFLVHPKSERLFAPLMKKYAVSKVVLPALASSSFRTLCVALPVINSAPCYAMVKVSLNETIGKVNRVLSLRECAGSVATTAVLRGQASSQVECMEERVSFVPDSSLLDPSDATLVEKGAGMIYRFTPACLSTPAAKEYIIPMFTLFGSENRVVLDLLINQSKKTPTQFITDTLLKPLVEAIVDLLYFKHVFIEAHGQNLLLAIETSDTGDVKIRILYRDMGGVSCLLSDDNLSALPPELRDEKHFYESNHVKDAGALLENIASRTLFNLTKQCFKSETCDQMDPEFAKWKSEMIKRGYSGNWTLAGGDPDQHEESFTMKTFYRYGYFEKIFGRLLLEEMSRKGIFVEISANRRGIGHQFFAERLSASEDPYNSCIEFKWFEELVLKTYPLHCRVTLKKQSCFKHIKPYLPEG